MFATEIQILNTLVTKFMHVITRAASKVSPEKRKLHSKKACIQRTHLGVTRVHIPPAASS